MTRYLAPKRLNRAVERLGAADAHTGLCEYLIIARALALNDGQPVPVSKKETSIVRAINEYMAVEASDLDEPHDDEWANFNVFGWARDGNTKGYRKTYHKNGLNTTIKSWNMLRREGKGPTLVEFAADFVHRRDSLSPDWSDWKASTASQPFDPPLISGKDRPRLDDVAVWFFRHSDLDEVLDSDIVDADLEGALVDAYLAASGLADSDVEWLFEVPDSTVGAGSEGAHYE